MVNHLKVFQLAYNEIIRYFAQWNETQCENYTSRGKTDIPLQKREGHKSIIIVA